MRAPAERPQNMPITPHESIAGHRFSYNRLRASRGGGTRTRLIRVTPPRTTRAALAGARCPTQLTSFCPAPPSHCGVRTGANGRHLRDPPSREQAAAMCVRAHGRQRAAALRAHPPPWAGSPCRFRASTASEPGIGRPRSPCEMRENLRQVERALGEVRKPKCQRMED